MSVSFERIVPTNLQTCVICQQSFTQESDALGHFTNTPARVPHLFHRMCIARWILEHPTCPICNAEITNDFAYISDVVRAALDGVAISDDRGEAIIRAAIQGHLAVVQALLAGGAILDNARGMAVVTAALNGHLAVVQALLASGVISNNDRGAAVKLAVLNGRLAQPLAVVQALLASGAISNNDRGVAVKLAALYGRLAVVQALLADGAQISDLDRGTAVRLAAENGNQDVVNFLQSPNQHHHVTRCKAVAYICFGAGIVLTSWLAKRYFS